MLLLKFATYTKPHWTPGEPKERHRPGTAQADLTSFPAVTTPLPVAGFSERHPLARKRFRLPSNLALVLVVLLVVSSVGSNRVYGSAPEIPCTQCDTQAIPDDVFARRYLGACMECGIMYGTGIEHCCVCYEEFTEQCRTALKKR
ncbi:hypothetical protein PoB_005644600 [Plakobranchus ocellatus]|uniref:Uncharacterized protein n=1 Tax=Plakobranchus ocellatus TaxID=259542 RepID=A0AAV4CEZ5_9GAST|nr:hypothetical protein PoB_005644600 [Plakobranchus ocellatus]